MRFAPGALDGAVQLLRSVIGPTQAKQGCTACAVAWDVTEDFLVRYSEMWASQASFERHVKSEEFRRVLVAMDMCRDEPRVVLGNLSGRSGMDYLRELRNAHGSGGT